MSAPTEQQKPKTDLYRTIRNIATARLELGLSRTAVDYLRRASECIAPDDLKDGRTPWYYERVDDIATLLGVDPRTVHNIEKRLDALGLVKRAPMANGHRWAKRCRRTGELLWVHGVSLSPLVERQDELAALATHVSERDRAYRATRQQVHALRARLRDALEASHNISTLRDLHHQIRAIYDTAPARVTRRVFDLEALVRIRSQLTIAVETLHDALLQYEKGASDAVNDDAIYDEISDASEISRPHIYDTIPIKPYSCSDMRDAPNSTDRSEKAGQGDIAHPGNMNLPKQVSAKGDKHILERPKNGKEDYVLTSRRMLEIAPNEWRRALDGINRIDWTTIGYVASARRIELGVSDQAWQKGIERMGEKQAAICLAVLDTNRDHPTRPVKSVGGAFVGMTRRACTGDLDLASSIQWIKTRKANGTRETRPAHA